MAPSEASPMTAGMISYLVNHVVLPPKLPQKDDYNVSYEQCLIDMVIRALQDLRDGTKDEDLKVVFASAVQAIVNLDNIRDNYGNVSSLQLKKVLQKLSQATIDETLPLEIKAQNSGLLVHRCGDSIVFESFELSPVNNAAMSAVGRLVRAFPGSGSKITVSTMQDQAFRESLSNIIAKMSTQAAPGCQPQVRKNGCFEEEARDTAAPTMVSDWLMNHIAAHGGLNDTVCISKNTREEVLWYDCKDPWRRSPLWLLIRVTLQLLFTRSGSKKQQLHGLYKAFVVQLLSRILQSAKQNWKTIGSETVYITYAKMTRRLRKLEKTGQLQLLHLQWITELKSSMVDAHTFIEKHWAALSKSQYANIDTDSLYNIQPAEDLDLKLPNLDAFLVGVAARRPTSTAVDFQPDAAYPKYSPDELPTNLDTSGDHKYFRIAALEAWIGTQLDSWLSTHLSEDETCGRIRRLMQMYYSVASTAYAHIPTSLSIMYISLLELWVASDKSACSLYPLLRQYDPELELDELQCLILPLKNQMQRLVDIESYVKSRRDAAVKGSPSVFRDFGHMASFAVKYFDQSPRLQTVLSNVRRDATQKQAQKRQELVDLKLQYSELMAHYNSNECETEEFIVNHYHRYTDTRHSSRCSRCASKKKADNLTIQIYEWPLSSQEATAKATIFECQVPQAFSDWRDTCIFLVADVLGYASHPSRPEFEYTLVQHHGLSHILSLGYHNRRIVPLSSIKSHTNTHRKHKKVIPQLQDSDICPANALRYAYFDTSLKIYTGTNNSTEKIVKDCMYRMPDKRSEVLRFFLYRPPSAPDGRTPNEVIAGLSDCPAHFSLEEYKSFGMLSSGRNIFYSNILTQLATPSTDFAKAETQTLLLQVIDQCGVANNEPTRVNHNILLDESFCHSMLEQLEISLLRVSENWESWRAAATFVALCRRILSFTLSISVRNRSLQFLAEARQVIVKWLRRLKNRANASTEDAQRTELHSRATEVALLCTQTFDVEDVYLVNVLQQQNALAVLLQSSIIVQENSELAQSDSWALHKIMLQSWKSLLFRAFHKIRQLIVQGNKSLDVAVLSNWADFQPTNGANWAILRKSHQHWLYTKSGGLKVYFNLLTAELLVNGLPLARLPLKFMQHQVYTPLFGKSVLEVVPTDWPGMSFSAKSPYLNYKLHFGMEGADMLVVAIEDGHTLDLLPPRLFKDYLPQAFMTDFVHWYDHNRGEVLFRAREDPWSSKNDGWRLVRKSATWCLTKDVHVLANVSSHTARTVSKIFSALEDPSHIHIVLNTAERLLHISLPRLQLDFQIEHRDNRIQSRQYRGMIVDPIQTTGALVGLTSKLVLRPGNTLEDRLVLIPVPRVFSSHSVICAQVPDQHHVSVSIDKSEAHRVFAYSLDTTLGRILESGDVQRRLFLALLHALTSHCLPDLLTGYTGTESALNILQSAAVRSFEFLTADNVDTLHQIAALAPLRSFYPKNLMDMQQVEWDKKIPSLSQHPQLRTCAEDIIRQARMMQLFYPDQMPNDSRWKTSNAHLEERDKIRSSTFRVCGFGADDYTSRKDVTYGARDTPTQSTRGLRAYIVAAVLVRGQNALHTKIPDLKGTLLQKHFKNASVEGYSASFDSAILTYDAEWLLESSDSIIKYWCNLHHYLPSLIGKCNKYDITAWLSTMAFADSADMCVLQAFVAFYRSQVMATVQPPSAANFDLSHGSNWTPLAIDRIIQASAKSFDDSAEARLPKQGRETNKQHVSRIKALFRTRQDEAIQAFINSLRQQWPSTSPTSPSSTTITTYVNVSTAMPRISAKFQTWFRNRQFEDYLQQTSALMVQESIHAIVSPRPINSAYPTVRGIKSVDVSFHVNNIFATSPPTVVRENIGNTTLPELVPPCEPGLPSKSQFISAQSNGKKGRLGQLRENLENLAQSKCEKDYVEDLRASCASLDSLQVPGVRSFDASSSANALELFQEYLRSCKHYFETLNLVLDRTVAGNDSLSNEIGLRVRHSPRISPTFWLSQLHRDRFEILPESWKSIIIEYGLAVTQLHRAQRLVALSTKPADLMEELGHVGHSNWDPREFPETLLLEAESGILIRREQEFIASHMRESQDATNIVLQLLMGGGKSSTIVPMLAAYLGDKKKLVRIIVAKPQSKQMLHMLVSKLGYLLNRRVYHMPFSRSLRPNAHDAVLIRQIYEECIVNRGVLLIQPEHILSFKLMAVEAILAKQACARPLLETQEFFDKVSRDIVDESDENFSVKFELIYTMGAQRSIEFAPERWLMIQAIVGLIPRFAKQVKNELPESIEMQRDDPGRFARVRILHNDASHRLLVLLAKHIVEFGIVGLPTNSQPLNIQAALFRYITEPELTATEIALVEDTRFWNDSTRSPLLLVRGLIAGGILHFALSSKRWRVNFGLDSTRVPETPLAVPFRSKDCPSPRSEFSHPDVVILLSLLSYYYGGLTDEQLFDSFAHLLKSDQGGIQYDEWVGTASPNLPKAFRQLSGVSIKDRHQCIVEIFPELRYSKKAIDYYLSSLVFPKAMKEFPQKLSASGWDIGAIKTHPVTGFSGTNDTLHLLPLTVKHLNLPSQSHTNALVLRHLLQEETSVELLPPRANVGGSDAEHLLALVVQMQPEVRVILDCGASILEQNNHQVAEAWLKMRDSGIQAVVFFEDEELSVLDRAGRVEPLQTSPFAKQLDVCLIYLDEAHTRGTDLKLPRDYRAAVTLGQGLVKDKLTQGCMRMRKLGVGQSVSFIVPEEISTKIRERTNKPTDVPIEVSDVLCWSIAETWQDLKRSMPLWAVQGERFERNKNLLCGAATTFTQAEAFLEDEARTLEARYKPHAKEDSGTRMLNTWDLNNQNIADIVTRCQEFEAMGFGAATLSEEQERELAPEIEEERQIERPVRLSPEAHTVHPDVEHLVRTGQLTNSKAFKPAFQSLSTTSAANLLELNQFPTGLVVTADFERTVKAPAGATRRTYVSDSYQRPVQFLLSVQDATYGGIMNLVIISPFEANRLVPSIRRYKKVTLHIFAPRANAAFAPLDKLELYNIGRAFSPKQVPRSLTVQLNLFTGSLYLRSFAEYTEVCDFLGLLRTKPVEGQQVYADGFIYPPAGKWGLTKSPVPFLRTLLMKIRREGEGIEKTHLGKILNGVRLEEADFNTDTEMSGT